MAALAELQPCGVCTLTVRSSTKSPGGFCPGALHSLGGIRSVSLLQKRGATGVNEGTLPQSGRVSSLCGVEVPVSVQ